MLTWLDRLLVQPLALMYGVAFAALPESLGLGIRLMLFGIVVNLVLMPVYSQAEHAARSQRQVRDRVQRDVSRMKRHFRGRERYFYVRAVHRQHGYHPIAGLLGSGDLLLQMLVFFSVLRFIVGHVPLGGVQFGPVMDLGRPDGLLAGLNVLPLVMTGLNMASVLAYSRDRRQRVQGFGLAILFLVLLYGSPAGLVLYWTASNAFSLVRSVVSHRWSWRGPRVVRRVAAAVVSQR